MRIASVAALVVAVTSSGGRSDTESYSGYLKDDGHTWCVYRDSTEFKFAVANLKPMESAKVTYRAGEIAELTYQVSAASGDWIVIDQYTPSKRDIALRRATRIVEPSREIIQEATVHAGKPGSFRLVRVTTLDGRKADLTKVDLPVVAVRTDLSAQPFIQAVGALRHRATERLCHK